MADLTTLLSRFLQDLYAGIVGSTAAIDGIRNGDGSASAPSYSFASVPTTGLYVSSNELNVSVAGTARYQFNQASFYAPALTLDIANADVVLTRDASNTLAQRNGTNAQVARGYRSFTDTSNYQRWALQTAAAYVELAAETAGTGADNISIKLTPAGLGHIIATLGLHMDKRTESAEATDSNVTYTTAQVLGGIITRSNMSANRVDAFPTAANLVAAIPGCVVGTSFDVLINNNDTAQTLTVNGASTGITYEGAATALAATEARLFKVLITNVTGSSEAATVFQVV